MIPTYRKSFSLSLCVRVSRNMCADKKAVCDLLQGARPLICVLRRRLGRSFPRTSFRSCSRTTALPTRCSAAPQGRQGAGLWLCVNEVGTRLAGISHYLESCICWYMSVITPPRVKPFVPPCIENHMEILWPPVARRGICMTLLHVKHLHIYIHTSALYTF